MSNNILHQLAEIMRSGDDADDPRVQAIAKTLGEAADHTSSEGLDLFATDLAEGLAILCLRAPRTEPADAARWGTLTDIRETLDAMRQGDTPPGPRNLPAQRLRHCAEVWRRFAMSLTWPDGREAAIRQRWLSEAAIMEAAAAEPRTLYLTPGPAGDGYHVGSRVTVDHDFARWPIVVQHGTGVEPEGSILGPATLLPVAWQSLCGPTGERLRAAVYENEPPEGSVLWRLRSGMPGGVIQHAKVLEMFVMPENPGHVRTHFGRAPIAIAELLEAVKPGPEITAAAPSRLDLMRQALDGLSDDSARDLFEAVLMPDA